LQGYSFLFKNCDLIGC